MKEFFKEFKEFAMKGNVVDLAVAVVIGGAFGKIVTSLVNNIIMPLIGVITGGNDLAGLQFTVGKAVVTYGVFLQNVVDFLIIALAIFIAIKGLKKLESLSPLAKKAKAEAEAKAEKVAKLPSEAELLIEIRDLLKKAPKAKK